MNPDKLGLLVHALARGDRHLDLNDVLVLGEGFLLPFDSMGSYEASALVGRDIWALKLLIC